MTPQIDHLGNMSPVLRVSTHIYGVTKDINRKIVIFRINLGNVTPHIAHLGKTIPTLCGFNRYLWEFLQELDGKTSHFSSKPRHVTPQFDQSQMTSISHCYCHLVVKKALSHCY